jgi:hypothetical protein
MQRESRAPRAAPQHVRRRPKTPLIGALQVARFRDAVVNAALAVVSFWLIIVVAVGFHGPFRYLPALVFGLFVPGRVAVGYWTTLPEEARLPVTVAISLALCTTLATLAVAVRVSDVLSVFYLLAIPSIIILSARALQFYNARRLDG